MMKEEWGINMMAVAAFASIVWALWPAPPKEVYTYEVTVDYGDTVYDIATRIATPKENINYLSWKICEDNHITDPGSLQPGTRLLVNVERAQ